MTSRFDNDGDGPEVTEVVAQVMETLGRVVRKFWVVGLLLLVVGASYLGVYTVGPGEQGVVRTFGRETKKAGPGLHFLIPFVQKKDVVNVDKVRRIEVGFRGDERVANEALMLTGDENIVAVQMIVQYRVTNPSQFLFRLDEPEETLRIAAEVALRSMVGGTNIDDVLTTGRDRVQDDTRVWLQTLMKDYQSGISISDVRLLAVEAPDEVREAFHDVARAREEKEKLINQAMGYREDLLPRARGEARKMLRDAEAYHEQRVLEATGDANKFEAMLTEYTKAERVTRERLYLETMERILSKVEKKTIVDSTIASGAVPILPLGVAAGAVAGGVQ